MRRLLLLFTLMFASLNVLAQGGVVTGQILDKETGEPLIGANAFIKGTTIGSVADLDGNFTISEAPSGDQILEVSYVGYEIIEIPINVGSGTSSLGVLKLGISTVGLNEVLVIASVAIDRKTPVAVSTIKGDFIESRLGSQEFPEILKSTPGIYVTKDGGGYGDGRINIRGFDAQNVAVMINGVPVNDMENARVYWSNWAGLSDVTGSMQVQRGLGASKVAVPSVGGTINIISKATEAQEGGSVSAAIGNDGYNKFGLQLSTGKGESGWAMTMQGTRTQGMGFVDGAEFLGYSYYINIAKEINKNHLMTFSVIGAKQKHGQRQNRMKIEDFRNSPNGIRQNNDWGVLGGKVVWVEDNFYHKPQIALNHYWTINPTTELATTAYTSFGSGGGGGTAGETGNFDLRRGGKYGYIDLEAITDINEEAAANGEGSVTYMRASRNDHNWVGLMSILTKEIGGNLVFTGGVDVRHYRGKHFREITNLLGGEYVVNDDDINAPNRVIGVGDKFDYHDNGIVGWIGAFAQAEYTLNNLTAFLSATLANTSYAREDFYQYTTGNQISDSYRFWGYTGKGGLNYNLNDNHNVFANVGYFERAPFFDTVFSAYDNEGNADAESEKVLGLELGYGIRYGNAGLSVNIYRTQWKDKAFTTRVQVPSGDEIYANILGVNAMHQGVELEGWYNPIRGLRFTGSFSMGDWIWQNNLIDVPIYDGSTLVETVDLYIKGLKVGDAAQTTAALGLEYELFPGFKLLGDFNYCDNLYARFDVLSRGDAEDEGKQALEMPEFGLFDFGFLYKFPVGNLDAVLNARLQNAFDTEYIPDALDADRIEDALVYYGFGRTWVMGVKFMF
ncbi:TonB-dependent receptor [Bacteroidota bacterium]